MRKPFDLSLYLVTDSELANGRAIEEIVEHAVSGGVTMVQLREKEIDSREFLRIARRLKSLLTPLGVPLIINDRMDIALAAEADGIHVGQSDLPVDVARRHLGPDALIGLSVESVDDAVSANEFDIDYIGISPVHTTPTKKELATGLGVEGVREIVAVSRYPAVGIGGLNHSNAHEVILAGAEGVAVVSAIVAADDPESAARILSAEVREARKRRGV